MENACKRQNNREISWNLANSQKQQLPAVSHEMLKIFFFQYKIATKLTSVNGGIWQGSSLGGGGCTHWLQGGRLRSLHLLQHSTKTNNCNDNDDSKNEVNLPKNKQNLVNKFGKRRQIVRRQSQRCMMRRWCSRRSV